jgi:hypothetical protein
MTSGKKSKSGKNAEFLIRKIKERLVVRGRREPVNKKMPRSCPEKETFLRAFMGEMASEERKNFMDHISLCSTCRSMFEAMTQLQAELKAREKAVEDREVSAAEMGELKRLAKRHVREMSGKKAFPILRPFSVSTVVLAAAVLVFLGYVLLTGDHFSDQTLRGTPQEEFRLIQPEGKLAGVPSVFMWTDVKGRDSFRIEIIDDELNILYQGGPPDTRLEIPSEVKQKIVKGKVYLWTVEAYNDNHNILASSSGYFEIE